jgi:hypothetical protein
MIPTSLCVAEAVDFKTQVLNMQNAWEKSKTTPTNKIEGLRHFIDRTLELQGEEVLKLECLGSKPTSPTPGYFTSMGSNILLYKGSTWPCSNSSILPDYPSQAM